MRLKKGDKVEVMDKNEIPASWRVAEILSSNGHMYHLKYESYPGIASQHKAETAPRSYLRPCQPLMQGEDFIVGDTVEVFYEYAWKAAAILKVLQGKTKTKSKKISLQEAAVQKRYYLVRMLGCYAESIVDGSKIRTKQAWHDDKWIPFEKSCVGAEDVTTSKPSTSICHQNLNFKIHLSTARAKKRTPKNCINILDESRFMESQHNSRLRKRVSPYGFSINGARNMCTQKLRAIEIDGRKQRLVASPEFEKLDAAWYQRENLGKENMHASLKVIQTGYDQTVQQAKIGGVPCFRSSESNSSENDASSVGSCSVNDRSPNILDMPFIHLLSRETEAVFSDAESCNDSDFERKSSSLHPGEEVEISIRRLELQAYHRTLEALYASGPLSWEQQTMLTNLRFMLHISNDEHLAEVKNLISAKTAGQAGRMLDLLPSLKLMPQFAVSHLGQCLWTILSSTLKLMQQLFSGTSN